MRVAPDLYFYPFTDPWDNNCNTVVIGGAETVLIDPGHKRYWPRLKAALEADGLKPADIKLCLLTHCHPDHMEAGEILEKEYGATQAMGALEAEFLAGPGRDFFPWMNVEVPRGTIGRLLGEGPIELADKTLEAILTPGHTPGSLSFFWPGAGALITGDAVFDHSVGRTDFPGGSAAQLAASVDKLAAIAGAETLLPGHGPMVSGAERVAANLRFVKGFF